MLRSIFIVIKITYSTWRKQATITTKQEEEEGEAKEGGRRGTMATRVRDSFVICNCRQLIFA